MAIFSGSGRSAGCSSSGDTSEDAWLHKTWDVLFLCDLRLSNLLPRKAEMVGAIWRFSADFLQIELGDWYA